ncbi:MAG: hypothetical protein P4L79_16150 [Legionella sp.]|uniref:hypothetical protein n=1 Tax=Legionella sp. TaxID=459 RepID=UPI00283E7735|nr:hypothetical protein [Legionella sp.]
MLDAQRRVISAFNALITRVEEKKDYSVAENDLILQISVTSAIYSDAMYVNSTATYKRKLETNFEKAAANLPDSIVAQPLIGQYINAYKTVLKGSKFVAPVIKHKAGINGKAMNMFAALYSISGRNDEKIAAINGIEPEDYSQFKEVSTAKSGTYMADYKFSKQFSTPYKNYANYVTQTQARGCSRCELSWLYTGYCTTCGYNRWLMVCIHCRLTYHQYCRCSNAVSVGGYARCEYIKVRCYSGLKCCICKNFLGDKPASVCNICKLRVCSSCSTS